MEKNKKNILPVRTQAKELAFPPGLMRRLNDNSSGRGK